MRFYSIHAHSTILIHHPVLRAFDVVELAGLYGPEEDEKACEARGEHEDYEGDNGPEHD